MPLIPPVEAKHVTVMLGGLPILRDISLTLAAGEIAALMGGNGSGKTTLVRTILGLTPHQHGTVRLFGTDLATFKDWGLIGYVPQRSAPTLRHATVTEVVAAGRLARRRPFVPASRTDKAAVSTSLERVGLTDRARDLFVDLSGGQQQRVLIARALSSEASLLVMDEPLAGVDLHTQQELADLVADLNADGATFLIVLHELGPFAPVLSRAIVLQQGRVVSDGPPPHDASHGHEHEEPDRTSLLSGLMGQEP